MVESRYLKEQTEAFVSFALLHLGKLKKDKGGRMNPLQLVGVGYAAIASGIFLGLKIPEKWEVRFFSPPLNIGICLFWLMIVGGCLTAAVGLFNGLLLAWKLIS